MNNGIEPTIEDKTALIPETGIDATRGRVVEQANNLSGGSISPFAKELSEIEGSFNPDQIPTPSEQTTTSSLFGLENSSSVTIEGTKGAGYSIPEITNLTDTDDTYSANLWILMFMNREEALS